ncbi:MAG: prepilin-type N-terminal cleavage/methylation domain-containing protein [Chitinivibrionales bacterium]|nr:prepilin-type N-terminal cleavage/methylation domain-containing protein [Chitinivibrionales bacterium]
MAQQVKRDTAGFTLLELLLGMVIFGVVMTILVRFVIFQMRSYDSTVTLTQTRQNIRDIIELIIREGRMAGYNPSDTNAGIYTFLFQQSGASSIDTTQFTIHQDLNGNKSIDGGNEWIAYAYDPQNKILTRTCGSGSIVLLDRVEGCRFLYKRHDGTIINQWTDRTLIERITIVITGQTYKAVGTQQQRETKMITMRADLVPRNRPIRIQ